MGGSLFGGILAGLDLVEGTTSLEVVFEDDPEQVVLGMNIEHVDELLLGVLVLVPAKDGMLID